MEVNACNIQVLLQAAEYLERRERGTTRAKSFLCRLRRNPHNNLLFACLLLLFSVCTCRVLRGVFVFRRGGENNTSCCVCCVCSGDLHFTSVLYAKARNRHGFENVAVILVLLQCIDWTRWRGSLLRDALFQIFFKLFKRRQNQKALSALIFVLDASRVFTHFLNKASNIYCAFKTCFYL